MCKETISTYEFFEKFPNEESARKFFEERRWRDGVSCPLCSIKQSITSQKIKGASFYYCGKCRRHFTVRTGTIMHRSHIPLNKWLYAMYLFTTARKGVSSLQLSKEIGVTQKSTWFLLQRIRGACEDNTGIKLDGIIEVDETYFGGLEKNKHSRKKTRKGRGPSGKSVVVGLRERGGRVKAKHIKNTKGKTLKRFISENVQRGAIVFTDEHKGYTGLAGYGHKTVKHSAKQYVDGMISTNGIESVWALIKRGYHGTFHHFSTKHLQKYVNEFSFRLNEGRVKRHTLDRMKSLADSFFGKRLTYKELIA